VLDEISKRLGLSQSEREKAVVSRRFPLTLTPLRNCLFTPELQWQFQG